MNIIPSFRQNKIDFLKNVKINPKTLTIQHHSEVSYVDNNHNYNIKKITFAAGLSACDSNNPHVVWDGEEQPLKHRHGGCDDVGVEHNLTQHWRLQVHPVIRQVKVVGLHVTLCWRHDREERRGGYRVVRGLKKL